MKKREPVIIRPPIYSIVLNLWRWCRLGDVVAMIPQVSAMSGYGFELSPEGLIHNFASLTRRNRPLPDGTTGKKIFRYSLDGNSLYAKPLPEEGEDGHPPYGEFRLEIVGPYPTEMFVISEWAMTVLEAVERGAAAAAVFDDRMTMGFPPEEAGRGCINLGGAEDVFIVKTPIIMK